MAGRLDDKKNEIREAAEASLINFIRLVHPKTMLGAVHEELCDWWEREDAKRYQLVLLPRDHQKSRMVAYRVVWYLTKHPELRVLYLSSTANLAEKQLKFMKDIFTSDIYRRYWPEHVLPEEGKREKWTQSEISLDHPKRKEENIRDPSIFTGGMTTGLTGMHCDIAVLDDVVVWENAYTQEGRDKVESQYSLLNSIETADAQEWITGTRYDPRDLYSKLMEMEEDVFNDDGDIIDSLPVYEKFERQVEDRGDGTGQFIWPRQRRSDGKWFGFDSKILATKRAKYLDKAQFRAQYYNDPNNPEGSGINYDKFQYYDQKYIRRIDGRWMFKNERLNVFAAMDFAYSLGKKSDYTSIVVVGVDKNNNYYVLDIDRFKTDLISEYYEHLLRLHTKWDFRKVRAEVTAAQSVIVKDLKTNYIKPNGIALSVEDFRPSKTMGSKEERIYAILQPKYDNMQIWHYKGGNCQSLEEELIATRPPHDDIKDALASAIDICVPPSRMMSGSYMKGNVVSHPKFGGVRF
jgi:phage terminase large subunit-like protein